MPADSYDAIIIGGGHNGLIAAAYLAKFGKRVVVLEARHKTGGATDTSQPWPDAPEFKVTTLSYVMSLMPPQILRDLELERHGYKIFPLGQGFLPHPDGRYLLEADDPSVTFDSFATFSRKDAEAQGPFYEWIGRLAGIMEPMLWETPVKIGSQHAGDLIDQLKFVLKFRKQMDQRTVADITKLFSMSAADVLREWFEDDVVLGYKAINGIVGTWAGPEEPGTAYVLMHHSVGAVEGGDEVAGWGFPEGGMGGVAAAIHASAEAFGAEIKVNSPVQKVLVQNGRATGVVLEGGDEYHAPVVITACHPQITFLEQIDRGELPDDFVRDIENWSSRSGTVKINLALDRLPTFTSHPEFNPRVHGGAIQMLDDLEYMERAFQQARTGEAATLPWADCEIPTVFDRTLAPEGKHIMSMFTQWVPETWTNEPHQPELEAYADRLVERFELVAPGFRDSILHRQVIGPHQMQEEFHLRGGNIFHGELTVNQLFHMRPAPGYADYRTPIKGLYQASSATHAGGGATGLPGHHVVREIGRDRALGRIKVG